MTIEKDRTMFGTRILNHKTKEVGLLIYTWTNKFADGNILYATCVDMNGKKYNIEMDAISPLED
ncbi:unknown [Clostridium sp. CAG:813]|nr:unknown [Clostridium sp. CAG:813]